MNGKNYHLCCWLSHFQPPKTLQACLARRRATEIGEGLQIAPKERRLGVPVGAIVEALLAAGAKAEASNQDGK